MYMFCKAYALGQIESGRSDSGDWVRRTLVCSAIDDEAKLIAFDAFGQKKCEKLGEIQQGQILKVFYTIEAREREGKWYNRVNLERFESYTQKS